MATTLLDVRKIKRPWRLICIAEKLFSHSGMQHTWGILRKCVLIKLLSFHGQIGSCIAVTYADSRATEHLVSISSGIVFAAEMASTMVESHGLKWLSPRTCVLEKWCHLSESNEALSWFNQSSLSEKEVERKSRGKGREGGGGIYKRGRWVSCNGPLLSKYLTHLHAVQKSPERKLTSRQIWLIS